MGDTGLPIVGQIGGEYPVGRGRSVDLAVVMTEWGCSSVSGACDFLLKSLKDDFLGVDCLVSSLYEQLGDSQTGVSVGLLTRGRNCDNKFWPNVGHLSQ